MKEKPLKGSIGYINQIKKDSLIVGFVGLLIFVVIYFSGIALTHTNKNYGTILAVLMALPTAQMFTRYFGYRPYKSVTSELVEVLDGYKNLSTLYEMLIVRGKATYFIDAIVVSNNQIVLVSLSGKALKQDDQKVRQELQTMMNHKGIKVNTEVVGSVEEMKRYMKAEALNDEAINEGQHEEIVRAFLGSGM